MTYYDELGINPDASEEEIRAAYRRKAKQHHPDHGGNPEKMARANKAYNTLSKPIRRLAYDRTGQDRPMDADKMATDRLLAMILEWMQADTNSGDLIRDVSIRIDSEQTALRANRSAGLALMEKLTKRLRKLKRKKRGVDFVGMAVTHRISEIRQQTEILKETADRLDRVRELLGEYEYELDVEPAAMKQFFITGVHEAYGT